jgi:CDGSH-type Zn-finger protein
MTRAKDAKITLYPNGPLLLRGSYVIEDESGRAIELPKRAIALCRCGKSGQKPWCDGTHKLVGFEAEAPTG